MEFEMKNLVALPFSIEKPSTSTEPLTINQGHWLFKTEDTLTRTIVDGVTQSIYSASWPTAEVNKGIEWYLSKRNEDVSVLQKYAKWQRKYIDFQATYAAFLLGAISEDEFETDSQQYAPNIREIATDELIPKIEHLAELLDFDLRASELAEYFETEQSIANKALEGANCRIALRSNAALTRNETSTDE